MEIRNFLIEYFLPDAMLLIARLDPSNDVVAVTIHHPSALDPTVTTIRVRGAAANPPKNAPPMMAGPIQLWP
jgi:hypothetical protein